LSGYEGQLGAGMVITGGASQLKNLDLYLTQKLKIPVRKTAAKKTLVNNSPDLINDPSFTQALGMLLLANEDCELVMVDSSEEDSQKEERSVSGGWFGGKKKKPRMEKNEKNEKKEKKPKQEKQEGGFFSKMEDVFGNIFTEEDDE